MENSNNNNSTRYVHYTRDFPPGFSSNVIGTTETDPQEKGLNEKADFQWRRKVGAVKSKPRDQGKCSGTMAKKKDVMKVVIDGDRAKVLEMLEVFRQRCDDLCWSRRNKGEDVGRIDLKAMSELIKEGKITKQCAEIVGPPTCGVEVGDIFRYRVELVLVGLHKHNERGIDTMVHGTKTIATCIVATEGHLDNVRDPNVLTYVGEGGKSRNKELLKLSDQQLKGGNLALCNSMLVKSPVRVVKGFKVNVKHPCHGRMVQRMEYVYDGLYKVISYEKKQGSLGNLIYEFKLLRCPGQPTVPWSSYIRN